MNDVHAPADAGGAATPTLESLMEKLSDTSLPQYGREKLLDQLEAVHKARADAVPADQPVEAMDAPTSGAAYGLEQSLPAGVEITDQAALGALKGSLATAGVPAEAATGAFGHIAQLFADGAYASQQAFDAAVTTARNTLHKVHGYDGAKSIIADATAQADILVRADPSLADHMEHAWASPVAIMTLANLRRFGGRKSK